MDRLSFRAEVIKARTPRAALLGVLLEAEPDSLTAKATDLETWVSQSTPLVNVTRAGAALVNADRLLSVAKNMTDDAVSLEVLDDHLHIKGAKAHFKLITMKPTDFPPFPAVSEATPFAVNARDLRRLVTQTAFAASRENGQDARAGVQFSLANGQLTLAATDARRLARARCAVESGVEGAALVPASMAKMILPMLSEAGKDDVVNVSLGERQAVFQYEGTVVATALMEGTFPDYEQLISKDALCTMTVGTAAL